ncbi:hypothetical protein [Moorena sp. SIO4G3]|uniref:hypothetical protein n=1 Tax=Moorena sp. SIO4G3 TaxID=2607821 RepID=UPI00142B1E8A|nr:hypothetical protein [Moorena sp. SIO4G3]NEO75651.1 hypothetical protein [Moorena sp. SIO4G3]
MNNFNIALYKGPSFEKITLKAYSMLSEAERINFETNLNQVGISLCVNGEEKLSHLISFGPLQTLLSQLGHGINRLINNEFALIRSGVLDVSEGHFLLIEPTLDGESALISLISISETPISEYFPNGHHSNELYDYILLHQEALIEQSVKRDYPVKIQFDINHLLKSLKQSKEYGALEVL